MRGSFRSTHSFVYTKSSPALIRSLSRRNHMSKLSLIQKCGGGGGEIRVYLSTCGKRF